MDITRKRYLALVGASIASIVLYVAKPEKPQPVKMNIQITAQGEKNV